MLSTVRHQNIVAFLGYSTNPQLLLVLEYVPGGDLSAYLKKNENPFASNMCSTSTLIVLQDISEALGYLHDFQGAPILHRKSYRASTRVNTN